MFQANYCNVSSVQETSLLEIDCVLKIMEIFKPTKAILSCTIDFPYCL